MYRLPARSGNMTAFPTFLIIRSNSFSAIARSTATTGFDHSLFPAGNRDVKSATSGAPSREPPYHTASKSPLGSAQMALLWADVVWPGGVTHDSVNAGTGSATCGTAGSERNRAISAGADTGLRDVKSTTTPAITSV